MSNRYPRNKWLWPFKDVTSGETVLNTTVRFFLLEVA
jgi:hypothetical protein